MQLSKSHLLVLFIVYLFFYMVQGKSVGSPVTSTHNNKSTKIKMKNTIHTKGQASKNLKTGEGTIMQKKVMLENFNLDLATLASMADLLNGSVDLNSKNVGNVKISMKERVRVSTTKK